MTGHASVIVTNAVDPLAGKITKRGGVFLGGQNLSLEASHLTGRGRLFSDGMNLGHAEVMTTLMNYGSVAAGRQAEIIKGLKADPK